MNARQIFLLCGFKLHLAHWKGFAHF